MKSFDFSRFAVLVTLILMLLIAGGFGYRLQVGPFGLIFERNVSRN